MFVRRANYKRRPGHSGDLETRLFNEDEISQGLHAWAANRQGEGMAHELCACVRLSKLPLFWDQHGVCSACCRSQVSRW